MTAYIQGTKQNGPVAFDGSLSLDGSATVVANQYTQENGTIIDIKASPTGARSDNIVSIEASGANWNTSKALNIVSDDEDCKPLILDVAADGDQFIQIEEDATGATGGFFAKTGGGIRLSGTTTNYGIAVIPHTTGITIVGDAGSTSAVLAANDDKYISGKLEVDGPIYCDFTSIVLNAVPPWGPVYGTYESVDDAVFGIIFSVLSGSIYIQAGDDEEWIRCTVAADNTVTKEAGSANSAASDTDGNLCVYQFDATYVAVRNRLGSTKALAYVYQIYSSAI